MAKEDVQIFGVVTLEDYLRIATQAVDEFAGDQANALRCIAATLILNHVPDWLDGKLTDEQRSKLGWARGETTPAKVHFESANQDLKLIRSLANGMKHLRINEQTRSVSGYGMGAYGIGPYGQPYLVIDLGEDHPPTDRWVVAYDLMQRVLDWWTRRLSVVLD